ncbi:MAG: hypothetical protein K2X03_21265 [Bryobacteraceae bacterium]|nr:hypothetical protein [Bryobacteraceae bacterium]
MKPIGPLLMVFSLFAAEVWDKKPFTEWSPKEVDRLMTSSPWARETEAAFGGGGMAGGMGGGGRGGRGGGGGGMGGGMPGGGGMGGGGGMEGGGGPPGGGGGGMPGGGGPPSQPTVLIRWQSALPMKQALIKRKFGSEAETSAQAKAILESQETYYVIAVEKLPKMGAGRPRAATGGPGEAEREAGADPAERMRQMLARATSLNRKGKDPIKPEDIKIAMAEKTMTVYFLFPRTDAITLADKEVEFSTRLGPLEIKRKFKLQEMVYAGKLEL